MFDDQNQSFAFNHAIWNQYPQNFDLQQPAEILPHVTYCERVRLNFKDTWAMANVRSLNQVIKTIIFDAQRGLLATPQSSQMLMTALSKTLIYESNRCTGMVAGQLGYSRTKLPVIQNQYVLCPLGAATRKSISWFGLQDLSGYQQQGRQVRLEFANQIGLTIPKSIRVVENQLSKARAIQIQLHHLAIQQPDNLIGNTQVIPNYALAPAVQVKMYLELSDYMLAKYGVTATLEDLKFYCRQFFGTL